MNMIYFTQASDEMLRQALKDGTRIICNSEPRDLPGTWRGDLWQELREAELAYRNSTPDAGLSADEICDLIEADFSELSNPYGNE